MSADPIFEKYLPNQDANEEDEENEYPQINFDKINKLPGEGGIFNSINLNLYHYAGNNPLKYIDPNGKEINVKNLDPGIYHIGRLREDLVNQAEAKNQDISNWNPKDVMKRHEYILIKDFEGNYNVYGFYPNEKVKMLRNIKGIVLKDLARDRDLSNKNKLKPYIINGIKFKSKAEFDKAKAILEAEYKNKKQKYQAISHNCQSWAREIKDKINEVIKEIRKTNKGK